MSREVSSLPHANGQKKYSRPKGLGCVLIPYLFFACREVPSSSTGYSPFELLYGKEVHGPLDVLCQQWVPTSKTPRDATEWLVQLRDSLDAMRATAAENQSKAKTYSKTYHDKTVKDRQFKIGDKVLVFSPVVTERQVIRPLARAVYYLWSSYSCYLYGRYAGTE